MTNYNTAPELVSIVGCDESPGSIRVIDVLYYNLPNDREKRIDEFNLNSLVEHPYEQEKILGVHHGTRKFNTFDEAVEFVDSLGDMNNMIEIASIHSQINTFTKPDVDFIEIPNESSAADFHYIKDVFNNSRLIYDRLKAANSYMGTTYKVTFAYLGIKHD